MNKVHRCEHALRSSLESLFKAAEAQNAQDLIVSRDIARSYGMVGAELIGHAEELVRIGSMIVGCEAEVVSTNEAIAAYRTLLPNIDESQVQGVRALWQIAQRTPPVTNTGEVVL